MKNSILITGGSGLLALNWAFLMKHQYNIYLAVHNRMVSMEHVNTCILNLESFQDICQFICDNCIDLVVHTAAMTSVERCESDIQGSYQSNVFITRNIAEACRQFGVKLIHISTDHLYDGSTSFVDEKETVCPLNNYARTKAEAEVVVSTLCPTAIIARTNFFGWGPPYRQSFSDSILNSLRHGKPINLFSDSYFTPILMESLIILLHELVDLGASGIFNVVGDDRISKFEFGLLLASTFKLDTYLVKSGLLSRRSDLVSRPLDMSLSNKKLCETIGRKIGGIDFFLARLKLQKDLNFYSQVQFS